jgi:hypothetical protein
MGKILQQRKKNFISIKKEIKIEIKEYKNRDFKVLYRYLVHTPFP